MPSKRHANGKMPNLGQLNAPSVSVISSQDPRAERDLGMEIEQYLRKHARTLPPLPSTIRIAYTANGSPERTAGVAAGFVHCLAAEGARVIGKGMFAHNLTDRYNNDDIARRLQQQLLRGSLRVECQSRVADAEAREVVIEVILLALEKLVLVGPTPNYEVFINLLPEGPNCGIVGQANEDYLNQRNQKIQILRSQIENALPAPSGRGGEGDSIEELLVMSAAFSHILQSRVQAALHDLQRNPPETAEFAQVCAKRINAVLRSSNLAIINPDTKNKASLHADRRILKVQDRIASDSGWQKETGNIASLAPLQIVEVSSRISDPELRPWQRG